MFCPWIYGQFVYTKNYTTDDGLLSNEINALYQDSRGLLWVGSTSGLLVKTMDQFSGVIEVNRRKFNNIRSIVEDDNHHIWLGSYSHGALLLYANDQSIIFNEANGLISDNVYRLFYHNKKIFVGTDKGVCSISTTDNSITKYQFSKEDNHQNIHFTSFFTYKNQVFACSLNQGVFQIDEESNRLISILPFQNIHSVLPVGNEIFYGTTEGVLKYNLLSKKKMHYNRIPYVWGYDVKNNSTIYFVSSGDSEKNGGLYQIYNDKITLLNEKFQLPTDDLISIAIDQANNKMYLGTQMNGLLEVYFDNPLKKIGSESIQCIAQTSEHLYVLSDKALNIYDTTNQIISTIPLYTLQTYASRFSKFTSSQKIIFYQAKVHNHSLWVSSNIGLFEFTAKGQIKKLYPIYTTLFDFYKNQLVEVVPEKGIRFQPITSLMSADIVVENQTDKLKNITDIQVFGEKIFLASSSLGIVVVDKDERFSLNEKYSFPEKKIKKIILDQNNKLLAVSEYDDIFEIDPSTYAHQLKISSSKLKGKVIETLVSSNNKLFVGTNKGINVFEGEKHYLIDREQGLESYQFTSTKSFNGNIYVGTRNGLYKITEYFENIVNEYEPTVRVFDVVINGKSIDKSAYYTWFDLNKTKLVLPYNENNVRIYFTDWNAKFPKKISFRYRLKQDEDWSNILTKREIDLNYLEPGVYVVELEIENLSTGKKYDQKLIEIEIKPNFFRTWTFYGILSFLLMIISFFVYRYRIFTIKKREALKNQLMIQQKEEEKRRIEMENEKIRLEKNQISLRNRLVQTRMKALRSQMNPHFIFNALNTLQYFIISQDRAKGLAYLSKFSKLVRDTLENSINDYITLEEEIQYLQVYTSIENMRFEDRQIEFSFEVDPTIDTSRVLIPPMITQPFVENSILHAFDEAVLQPRLKFIYTKENNYLVCEIIDNGIGFSEKSSKVNKHVSRGMSLVRERIKLLLPDHPETIQLHSLHPGTHVRIVLPFIEKVNHKNK